MSLINEALRKARQEAAEREAEEKGIRYRPPRAHLPRESKLGVGLVLGLAVGVLAAAAGGGVAWYLLSRDADPAPGEQQTVADLPPAASPSAAASSAGVPAPPGADAHAVGADVDEPGGPPVEAAASSTRAAEKAHERAIGTAEAPPDSRPAPAATDAASATPSPTPPPPPPPAAALPAPAQARQSATAVGSTRTDPPPETSPPTDPVERPAPFAPSVEAAGTEQAAPRLIQPPESVGQVGESNVFVLRADLGDVALELDFIVWSARKPFAQINGEQVEVGQLVEGLLLERIEKDRVTLRGADGSIVLRVR